MKLIDKDALIAEIEKLYNGEIDTYTRDILDRLKSNIDTLEVKEVDMDKQAEWIANGIMIAVQSAKLHTNVYNPDRRDYDHSHLMQAARRGIELGLKIVQKGEDL